MAVGLFQGKVSSDLTGPIGIAVLTNEVRQFGVISVLQFMALLSISLAALNILPLPALDGGRTMFVLWTAITKRPISQRTEAIIHTIGFYALLVMVFLISIRDVKQYDVVQKILSVFGK
jgi:regulator of sigma E protease